MSLKVLHVIPAVAPRYGGPSRVIFEMCRSIQQKGTEVLVATTDADGAGHLPVEAGAAIAYQRVPTIFFKRQLSEVFGYSFSLARWLNDNVKNFDVVHIHAVFSHPCLAAARACRRSEVPYIVRPLGSLDPWSMRQKPHRKKLMWHLSAGRMLSEAAAVHYTTGEEQQLAEASLGLTHGVVIPLGIEMGMTEDATGAESFRRNHPSLDSNPYILTLSRLHPKKNIESLLEAFLALVKKSEFETWRLVIAGDGETEYIASLKRLTQVLGGNGKVLLTGWLGGAHKAAALREAALLALTSRQENFGLCVVEALACGVPVVVSDRVNLATEIENAGAGWVTTLEKTNLERVLAEALCDEGERRRRGLAGLDLVERQFSWSKVADELNLLYRSVVRKAPALEAQYAVP